MISFTCVSNATGNNIMMDEWLYAVSSGYIKTFESGYPTMSSVNKHIRFQSKIAASEANGFNITEDMIKNVTAMPFERSTFTAVSKGIEKEVRITSTIKFSNKV